MSSNSNRSAEALRNLPPTTLGVITACVIIHIIQSFFGWNIQLFTMCPRLVLFTHEYYRVFTSVFFHTNLMHIGMNMISTAAISSKLEEKIGTMRLLFSIWWAILLTSAIYILIAYVAHSLFGYDAWMYQHSVGYSGIIFHLSVLESQMHPGPRSVFGFFSVPAFLYPWVLLLTLQLIMPNLSFLGHLAGILNGTLEYNGFLDVLFFGDSFLVHLESLPIMRKLVALDNFVATTQGSGQRLRAGSSPSTLSLFRSIRKAISIVFKFVMDILRKSMTCLCGRKCRKADSCFGFWKRRQNGDADSGVIRPPEFYDGVLSVDDRLYDDDDETEPLASRII